MEELAALPVRAVHVLVVALAGLGLVVSRHVCFFLKFVLAVCEGARVVELAVAGQLPILAHFCLVLDLELLCVLRCHGVFL